MEKTKAKYFGLSALQLNFYKKIETIINTKNVSKKLFNAKLGIK